eukprot:CAMPEP_0204185726 /NCGR_PEP_ID=MMETSP0361-20130328/55558_1 /ASSEMBLY_ACC=CAM_ASM_000343 /TAXON_ID=268821 /ORGANISM="Scrippsiella Hangoei, Strain SHTV-5" /LENGTH=485 /DNA_ID=CAMNT_0051145975 /DNA_START=39 /DNA_END=1497 /DNA_ORIENTATION=+
MTVASLLSPEWLGVASLVAVAGISVAVGPHSWLPFGLVLAWCVVMGIAAVNGWLRFGNCCAAEDCGASSPQLQSLVALATPGKIMRELDLEGLTLADALVLVGAVAEFGGRVGLERLALTGSPALGADDWRGLLSTALSAPQLRLIALDLSGNVGLDDGVTEALVSLLADSSRGSTFPTLSALEELRLAECSLSAVAVASVAGWLTAVAMPGSAVLAAVAPEQGSVPPPPPPFAAVGIGSSTSAPEGRMKAVPGPPLPPAPPLPPRFAAATGKEVHGPLAPPSLPQSQPLLQPTPLSQSQWSLGGASLLELVEGSQLRLLSLSDNDIGGCGRSLARMWCQPRLGKDATDAELEGAGVGELQVAIRRRLASGRSVASVRPPEAGAGEKRAASNELAALASHLEASKVEDLGLESNELGRGSALSALEHAYSKRPIANLRLEGNRLSQRELADLMASLKRLRSKSGIDFSMASCRAGCDCNGRGEVM